jgi:hypothetical protein
MGESPEFANTCGELFGKVALIGCSQVMARLLKQNLEPGMKAEDEADTRS